jgi:hypothetical protein
MFEDNWNVVKRCISYRRVSKKWVMIQNPDAVSFHAASLRAQIDITKPRWKVSNYESYSQSYETILLLRVSFHASVVVVMCRYVISSILFHSPTLHLSWRAKTIHHCAHQINTTSYVEHNLPLGRTLLRKYTTIFNQILFTFDLQYAQLFLYECLDVYTLLYVLQVDRLIISCCVILVCTLLT